MDECGAPVVSIAGGEPLIHNELPQIVEGIIARKKFVYLCTNSLLLPRKIDHYKPSPYFTWSIHLDGTGSTTTPRSARKGCTTARSAPSSWHWTAASGSPSTAPCSWAPIPT